MFNRKAADIAAFVVALLVAVGGAALVFTQGPPFEAPKKTTVTAETGTGSGVGKITKSTSSEGGGPAAAKKTTTVETPRGAPSGKTTRTVEDAPRSFLERTLGESGLILLQIAIVVLAAFLAGAFVQRLMLGDFALKFGVLELGEVQEKAEDTLEDLTAKVTAIIEGEEKREEERKGQLNDLFTSLQGLVGVSATLTMAVSKLDERVKTLEGGDDGNAR